MKPEPKTTEQFYNDLLNGKPIKKEIHLQKALESRGYLKWKREYYRKLHNWWRDFVNDKQYG
jgi:hypothetical protein